MAVLMHPSPYNLLIVGGGINGASIARDAAGRGLSVALVEAGDLGGGASSASTKLIHGGLRYLEFHAYRMVAKALAEREVILSAAPHLAWPMPFILPWVPGGRPHWQLRAGLLLYDNLARRAQVPSSAAVRLRDDVGGRALQADYAHGFRYWDGWVDDARLVIANARDAAARGATILPRTALTGARYDGELWQAQLSSGDTIAAHRMVNVAGPWAAEVAALLGVNDGPRLSLVQGTHLVVRRIHRSDDAYMLQQPDGRIVFVIPYEGDFSLIGTTEHPVTDPAASTPTPAEEAYLLEAVNRFFRRRVTPADVVHRFAGVRPLVLEDGKGARETTRDWRLLPHAGVPALTVIGGKLTTCRLLAEAVLKQVAPGTKPWTAAVPLPGGDVPRHSGETAQAAFARWQAELTAAHADYDPKIVRRLARLYGTEAAAMLDRGLGANLGGLFTAEIEHMIAHEWARTPDDVLWRRSKMGLHLTTSAQARVAQWMGVSAAVIEQHQPV